MRFICLLLVLLTISKSHPQIPSPTLLPLNTILEQQGDTKNINELGTKSDIVLPNGRYHVSDFEITSTSMNMIGNQSAIFPSSTTNNEDFSDHSESNGFADEKEDKQNQLFRISNSTIWMSELTFECGSVGSSIASICGSCLRIGGSRVISNSDRTPFVIIGGDSGKSSSITIIACSHTSSCFPSILPLTSLSGCDSWTSRNQESCWLGTEVLVMGSEISVCDACLIGGSGALFDFCGLGQTVTDGCSMTTTLSSSLLLNTTSSSGSGRVKEGGSDFGNSWSVSQKMIGSCVSLCTNHLYGTGIRDLNLGGSVLCSNTSFTHCTTTTTDHSKEHFVVQTEITTANTLHLFSLCTFKGCSSTTYDGGAIFLFRVAASLEIDSCSFHSCSAPSGCGGAILYHPIDTPSSLTVSSSSFVKCSSNTNHGGSLYLSGMEALTISDCVFLDSRTTRGGGAILIYSWSSLESNTELSNCLFRNCSTNDSTWERGGSGAIQFNFCSSIQLNSLRFRECVAATGNGHDLLFDFVFPTVSLATVSNCASTSTPKESRIFPTDIAVDDVLPDPTETTTILSLIYEPTTSTTTEIVVKLDKVVTGSLLVLVSNSEGTARTDATKAPNIGRLLLFTIESSKSGRCTANIGETDLLQLPLEDYKLVAASLPNHAFSFSDVFIKYPTLTSAECVLDESHTHALLIVEGSDLVDEPFKLILQNGSILEASFSDNKATIDLGVIGGSSGWMENQMFVIMSGKKKNDASIVVSIPSPLYFTIPLAARLTSIELSGLNDTKTTVTLSFSSRLLKANQNYEITLERKDGSEEVVIDLATDNNGLLSDQTVKLYPSNGNMEGWKNSIGFGEEYEVIGVSAKMGDTDYPIQFSPILLKMPIEPVRLTSASCTNHDPDRTLVTLKGSGFVLREFYTVSVSGYPIGSPSTPSSSLHNTSFVVNATTSTEATSSPLQLHPTEGSQLKYEYSYTIVGISNGSVEGVVHSVVFETQDDIKRDEALITKIEVVLANSLNTSVVIEVSGMNLPSETVGSLTLNTSFSFDVSFSSSSFGRSAVIELGVSGSLGFCSEYELTSLEDSNNQPIQISETTITTPPKPTKLSLCVCGNEERSGIEMSGADPENCNSIKSTWNRATSLRILDTTMRVVDSVDLSSPLIVTNRVPFNLISFQAKPATLRASPSSSHPSSVLVSVEEGGLCRLTLLTITADLSVSTFRLVSASKGTVVLQYCSISGTRQSESNSEDVSICGWSSGLIELFETDTELNGVMMKDIKVGGIWMRGGKLNITKCDFSQNGPSIADFPSARQNIHCEGEGVVTIRSLSEGDGTKNSRSAWLDVSECSIEGDEDITRSPLFVPTLNSTESKVEADKSGKQTVKVVGKTLIPCGLSLEVFEWDSSKNVEGRGEIVDLPTSTATQWNETEIVIPFPEGEVGKLNKKMELRGRLVFGNGERTSNWMVVSGLGSGNKSLGGTESKWWIPVIISLSCALLVSLVIVVCVCLLRKRHSTRKELSNEEMSPAQVEFDEKMEENDPITGQSNSALSSLPSVNDKQGSLFGQTRFANEEGIPLSQSYLEVIVCNENMERSVAVETDTLFNALHNPHSTRFVEKRKVSQAIAKGLVSLVEMNVIADVLTHLSPHWVLFDQNDRVSLKMRENQSVAFGESVIGEGGKKMSEDGQRWMAPEVLQEGWKLTKENADHGAVFSLGLVLCEIETGLVPFGEVDGATAQRRLASSEKPLMEKVRESMEAIILPCLSLDPSLRPTLKTVLSQLNALDSVPQPSNEKEGNVISKIG
ncbi:hypothetical protein BLNAU_10000 [Blattamonas nauphoetae]|uniref:Protein kinase domain-containing protein n=1 Tax=Blattamonas nauphoetae TaxID=2049346 RepID=A0ABQ9XUB8_9EUKA|nr:hypothetical protein BLNAU_10000 [Blattamonas nauphoetae]